MNTETSAWMMPMVEESSCSLADPLGTRWLIRSHLKNETYPMKTGFPASVKIKYSLGLNGPRGPSWD